MTLAANRPLLITAAIGALIAWLFPFDTLFLWVTHGKPWAGALLMALLTLADGTMARQQGLRIEGHSAPSPLLLGLGVALAMALYGLLIDLVIFSRLMPANFLDYLDTPTWARLLYYMPRAFTENILYRLFLFTLLCRLFAGANPGWRVMVLITLAEVVNVGANAAYLSAAPLDGLHLAHYALRYVLPGVVWGVLYVRNGFFTAEVASVSGHLFLQPGFSLLR